MTKIRTLLETALALAAEGLRVFPLHEMLGAGPGSPNWRCSCGSADCDKPAKHPRTATGFKEATTDPAIITAWWARWPNAPVGVTGDDFLGVDVDGDEGAITLGDLCAKHGPLPITRCVRTGRVGGWHFYYRNGQGARSLQGKPTNELGGYKLDTKTSTGYVVGAGRHESGRYYLADDAPIADAPQWIVDLLTPKVVERTATPVAPTISTETTPYGKRAIELECEKVRTTPKGTRNDQLFHSAISLGQLETGGEIAYGDAGPALEDAAIAAGLPPGPSWKTIYKSGLIKGRAEPRKAPERDDLPTRPAQTSKAEKARSAATKIETRAREAANSGAHDQVAEILTALGDDGSLANSNTPAAIARVATLARDAANRLDGPRLALALRATDGARREGF